MEHDERRNHGRSGYDVRVTFESEHTFWTGFSENISEGGLFISSEDPLEVGESMELTFTPPYYSGPIRVKAIVRWIRKTAPTNEDAPPGFGVEFIGLPAAAIERINAFIAKRQPLFYDSAPESA